MIAARIRELVARFLGYVRRRDEQEFADEIQLHLDMLESEYRRRGLTHSEARSAARRDFGGVTQARELRSDQQRLPFFDALRADLGFALRGALKSWGLSSAVILTIALAVGANTAIFS